MIRSLIIILSFLFSNLITAQTQISIDSVSSYLGQHVKVCDKVADTYKAAGEGSMTYLNFGGKYPDHKFTVVIFAKDLINFPFSPVEHYKNHNVCITGMAAQYKGKSQIVARFPVQIEIESEN
jgi:hypothetical protein